MFVLIFLSACYKTVSAFRHKYKKIVNFNCLCGGSAKPKLQQESPRLLASVSPFFCSLMKFADFHTQRKAKTLYVNILKCYI